MPLPPDIVRVKRKATQEPVESLRLHESAGKRRLRKADFVYHRQTDTQEVKSPTSLSHSNNQTRLLDFPISHDTRLGIQASSSHIQQSGSHGTNTPGDITPPLPTGAATPIPRQIAPQPRRFHISRSAKVQEPTSLNPGRKRRSETLFVERSIRPKSANATKTEPATTLPHAPQEARPQKKPGLSKHVQLSTSPKKSKPDIVFPARSVSGMPWDINSEELALQMQAYTLQEIGKNIDETEAERPAPSAVASKRLHNVTPSKFKPKKPALRYAERHPEEIIAGAMDIDRNEDEYEEEEDTGSESDYIIDTYVRVPVDGTDVDEEAQSSFGFLVLDSQPDIDEFYRHESDSEDEDEDEDEDENAENHYTADYPDEEVASDDEYDLNAYHYSKDLDEFDDDDAFSDEEAGAKRYAWMKASRPAGLHGGGDDEDE